MLRICDYGCFRVLTMGTVTRLDEVRRKRRDPRELMASELRRVAPPISVEERHTMAAEYRSRADALEAAADDVVLFDANIYMSPQTPYSVPGQADAVCGGGRCRQPHNPHQAQGVSQGKVRRDSVTR